jgi:hypothetical protein
MMMMPRGTSREQIVSNEVQKEKEIKKTWKERK